MESKLERVGVLVEGYSEEDSKPADGHHVVSSAGGDDESGDTLGHSVASVTDTHEAGDDDGGRDSGQDKAEHEANGEGEVEEEEGEHCHSRGLYKAGDEGGSENHSTESPESAGIHLEAGPDQDDGQAERPQLPSDQRIQLVTNVLGRTVLHHAGVVPIFGPVLVGDTSLEGSVLLNTIEVVDAVHKTSVSVISGALGSPKLTKVIRNILQSYADHEHPKEWGEGDVDTEDLGEEDTEILDELTAQEGKDDENEESEDSSSGSRDGSEDGPGGEEDGGGDEEEGQEVGRPALRRTDGAGGGGGGLGDGEDRPECPGGGAGQEVVGVGVQSQVWPATVDL